MSVLATGSITIVDLNDGAMGAPAVAGSLSNVAHGIPTDAAGNNPNFTGAATTMTILEGGTDTSASWNYVAQPSAGVGGSLVGRTYTINAIAVDSGYVDITASRTGYADVVCRFSVWKSKTGATGATGAPGADGKVYRIRKSANAVVLRKNDAFDPTTITFSAESIQGTGQPQAYLGRFIIFEHNGTAWEEKYRSASDESTKVYTPSLTAKQVRAKLFGPGEIYSFYDADLHAVANLNNTSISTVDGKIVTTAVGTNPHCRPTPLFSPEKPASKYFSYRARLVSGTIKNDAYVFDSSGNWSIFAPGVLTSTMTNYSVQLPNRVCRYIRLDMIAGVGSWEAENFIYSELPNALLDTETVTILYETRTQYSASEGETDGIPGSSWTPTLTGANMSRTNDTITRGGTSQSDDHQAKSPTGYAKCRASWKPSQANKSCTVGITNNPDESTGYGTIDWAFYHGWDGTLYMYENGSSVGGAGSYNTNTSLEISFDGTNVVYKKDGSTLRTVASSGNKFFDSSFYEASAINTVRFVDTNSTPSWHDTFVAGDKFKRVSIDGGVTWIQERIQAPASDIVPEVIPYVPVYRGRFPDASWPPTGNNGDTALRYSSTQANRGIYLRSSGTWTRQTTPTSKMLVEASLDIAWAVGQGFGSVTDYTASGDNYFTQLGANTILASAVFAQQLVMGASGYIQSSNFVSGTSGFKLLSGTGILEAVGAILKTATLDTCTAKSLVIQNLASGTTVIKQVASTRKMQRYKTTTYVLPEHTDPAAPWRDEVMDGGGYTDPKVFKFQICASGTIKVTIGVKTANAGTTAFGRIYKNGAAVGTERSTTSTTGATWDEDISVAAGDMIELWIKGSNITNYVYPTAFALKCSVAPGILSFLGQY